MGRKLDGMECEGGRGEDAGLLLIYLLGGVRAERKAGARAVPVQAPRRKMQGVAVRMRLASGGLWADVRLKSNSRLCDGSRART